MGDSPLSNGPQSDRDGNGRFKPGHRLPGPGNPNLMELNRHRAAMLSGVKDRDIKRAMKVMVEIMDDEKGKPTDRLAAAKALLDRVLGTPASSEILERIEALEQLVLERQAANARH
jgi:hypothetical protein